MPTERTRVPSGRRHDDDRDGSANAGSSSSCLPRAWRGSSPRACTTCACSSIASTRTRRMPLPVHGVLGGVELVREAATLVMLLAVGMLAGRTMRTRLGYVAIAFGVWDILYYVFLRMMDEWPRSLFDWDILFLLPLPWWGPMHRAMCIALLMIVGGTCVTQWPGCHATAGRGRADVGRRRHRTGALRLHGRRAAGRPGRYERATRAACLVQLAAVFHRAAADDRGTAARSN